MLWNVTKWSGIIFYKMKRKGKPMEKEIRWNINKCKNNKISEFSKI
jgi:hypothetical protein